jgi:RecJ-like exonuclease
LAKAYEDNEVKADKTYKDKTVLVTGKVTEIGVTLGQTYVVLSSGDEFSLTGIQCFFEEASEIDKLSNLKDGDTVKIQGVVNGKSIYVGVNDCILK